MFVSPSDLEADSNGHNTTTVLGKDCTTLVSSVVVMHRCRLVKLTRMLP